MTEETTTEPTLYDRLAAPFDQDELKFFPVSIDKETHRGKVGTYIDARRAMDRLDEVMGPANWQTSYEVLDSQTKAVMCRLSLRFEGEWITKADVGYPNEGRDASNADKEPLKAAYSDALKRAAVQFGIGRFIYRIDLENDWLPLDSKDRFAQNPKIRGERKPPNSSAASPPRPSAAPRSASAGPAPASQADYQPDPRLGEWASPDGPNWQGYEDFLHDQTISFEAKKRVAPGKTAQSWSPAAWIKANPDKTIADLTTALIAEQRGIEAERQPVGAR